MDMAASRAQSLPPYEELEHTADLRLLVRGRDLGELFAHAAEGMFSLMQCVPMAGGGAVRRTVELEAQDVETLLVDWLGELLFLSERHGAAFERFHIERLEPTRLVALAAGTTGCTPTRGIKAVTFSDLRISETPGVGHETVITFDV